VSATTVVVVFRSGEVASNGKVMPRARGRSTLFQTLTTERRRVKEEVDGELAMATAMAELRTAKV
jgi:hypothetical protein